MPSKLVCSNHYNTRRDTQELIIRGVWQLQTLHTTPDITDFWTIVDFSELWHSLHCRFNTVPNTSDDSHGMPRRLFTLTSPRVDCSCKLKLPPRFPARSPGNHWIQKFEWCIMKALYPGCIVRMHIMGVETHLPSKTSPFSTWGKVTFGHKTRLAQYTTNSLRNRRTLRKSYKLSVAQKMGLIG